MRGGASAAIAVALLAWACSSNETKPTTTPDGKAAAAVDETIQHEKCDVSMGKADAIDANGDGKPDITSVVDAKSGRQICRVTDLNHDSKPEMYEYYDDAGNLRRRELSFEHADAISAIEIYKAGKLSLRMLDTTGQRRVDTWDYYDESGRRTKRERDTSNNGRVDQWWIYNADGTITIAVDRNADGQPDPEGQITVTENGATVAPDAGNPSSTSTSNGEAGAPPPPPPPVIMPMETDAGVDAGADAGKKKKNK